MIEYESFTSFDNKIINYITWKAPKEKTKLICIHGLGSYAACFNKLGVYAKKYGVTVTAMDLRGFGTWQYANKWSYSNFDHIISDLDILIKNSFLSKHDEKNCFILGDSLGALLALAWLRNSKISTKISGLIFVSPYFVDNFLKHTYHFLRLLGKVIPNKRIKLVQSFDKLTKDKSFKEFDNKIGLGAKWLSVGVLVNVLELSLAIEKHLSENQIETPILWLHGENDIVTKSNSILKLSKKMQFSKHTIKVFKYGHHFLLNDLISQSVYESIIDFVVQTEEYKMNEILLETVN